MVYENNSPSGKLVQIEHALTAVGSGQTSLGIKGLSIINDLMEFLSKRNYKYECGFFHAASNGVVIATEKKLPSILVDEASVSLIISFLCSPCFVLFGLELS